MKKEVISVIAFILFSLILLTHLSLAVDITLTKSSYFQGETLQAEIPDIFLDSLTLDNIGLYKDDNVHKTPVKSGLIKDSSENQYLFYAVLPEVSGNYILKLDNIKYYENGQQTQKEINKIFTITPANQSYLSFDPGFVQASTDFSIIVKGYNLNQQVTATFSDVGFSRTFNLGINQEKTIYFPITGIDTFTKSNIQINSYNIPVIIIPQAQNNTNNTNSSSNMTVFLDDLIEVSPSELEATILPNLNYYLQLNIHKLNNYSLSINFSSLDDEITFDNAKLSIPNEGYYHINITVNSKRSFNSSIEIIGLNDTLEIPINITLTENNSDVDVSSQNKTRFCKDFGGTICDSSKKEVCQGMKTTALDGECCLVACAVPASSTTWIWGLLLLLIVGLVIWLFFKKSNQQVGDKIKSIFSKRTEDYENKINPPAPDTEVRRSLTKT